MNCTKNLSPTNCDLWKDRDSQGCSFCEYNTENYEVTVLEAAIAELKARLAESEAERDAWISNVSELQRKLVESENKREVQEMKINRLQKELASVRNQLAESEKLIEMAQAILTALNTGDIQRESLLHKELRKVVIEYREHKAAEIYTDIEKRCQAAESLLGKLGWDLTAEGWRNAKETK